MIIKEYQPRADIGVLEQLVASNQYKEALISKELRILKAGDKAEAEAARMLSRWLSSSKHSIVINDLRLMAGSEVLQIDHLIINRTFRFCILETKSFSHGLRVNEHGEFFRKLYDDWIPIRSPIAQADSQRDLLERFLIENKLLPTRLGMRFTPDISAYVMISPETIFEKPPGYDTSRFMKFDTFMSTFEDEKVSVGKLLDRMVNIASHDTLCKFAQTLADLHIPQKIDWFRKLNLKHALSDPSGTKPSCKACSSNVLEMAYGRHGYYFKCPCGINTSLKLAAGTKIRKDGKQFFLVDPDGKETPYHQNS